MSKPIKAFVIFLLTNVCLIALLKVGSRVYDTWTYGKGSIGVQLFSTWVYGIFGLVIIVAYIVGLCMIKES